MTDSTQIKKIDKSDMRKVYWRQLFGIQVGWNYEKMMGLGYCYSMIPVIKKLYNTKEKISEALKLHLQFFNTNPTMAPFILGADIALEEKMGLENKDAVNSMKIGLMGPFAGIGDTIFVAIYRAIVFSISAYLALEGNIFGAIFPIITAVAMWWVKYKFLWIGYHQGQKIASGFSNSLQRLNEAATILGLIVIGALIPSVITGGVPYVYKRGEVTMELQGMLDKIMPSMVPVAVVLLSYWLLGRKNMTSTKLIFILLFLGIILGALNILG